MEHYYVYQYVREDGTPYYIGKGKADRAWVPHKRSNGADIRPSDSSRIIILKDNLLEQQAFDLEKELIAKFGLKENGGILVNMTTGGQGQSPSLELRKILSERLKGLKRPPRTEKHKQKLSKAGKGKLKPRSAEHQLAWNESSKRNWSTNEDRKKQVAEMGKANKGRKHTAEALEKKRQAMIEYWKKKKSQSS